MWDGVRVHIETETSERKLIAEKGEDEIIKEKAEEGLMNKIYCIRDKINIFCKDLRVIRP